jgi:catechol 2,3-dioxygenase-like lactoylglutathione lyase family enzyme
MSQRIGHVALVVSNYDEAIKFFTSAMGFELLEDTRLDSQKRWVLVGPKGTGTSLLLAEAATQDNAGPSGIRQAAGFSSFCKPMISGATIAEWSPQVSDLNEEPREESYGVVAVFEDLCGNIWDFDTPQIILGPDFILPSFRPFLTFW